MPKKIVDIKKNVVHKPRVVSDFKDFIEKYGILTIAVGYIMGLGANEFIKAFVNDLIMPLFSPVAPEGNWESLVWNIGGFSFQVGSFISAAIYFISIVVVVFLVVWYILRNKGDRK